MKKLLSILIVAVVLMTVVPAMAKADRLEQIKEKEYIKGLDGYRTILYYGIAFFQKTALVICQVAE